MAYGRENSRKLMTELPKVAQQRLRVSKGGAHPEANLLNAFAERNLTEPERLDVLAHLGQCDECREVVFLAQPEIQKKINTARGASRWLGWRTMRWVTAAACVVVVGAAVTLRHERSELSSRPAGARADAISEPSNEKAALQPGNSIMSDTGAAASLPLAKKQAVAKPREEVAVRRQSSRNLAPQLSASASTASPPMEDGRLHEKKEARDLKALTAADKSDDEVPAKAKPATGWTSNQTMTQAMIAAPAALAPKWRLASNGSLQRTTDASKTWETISVSDGMRFLTLFSLGNEVWVGGERGALYHSSDAGSHWISLKPSVDGQSLTGNLAAIEFLDPQHGKVTTSDHEVWTTEDAGQSWQLD